jgi:hypothetical protein
VAGTSAGIEVKGLREMQKAARIAGKTTNKEVQKALRDAGGPVADRAESLARSEIRNATLPWSRMKVGSTVKSVYITPAARRSGGSPRPNYGVLLLERAMNPAVEQTMDETVRRLEKAIDEIEDVFEKG